MELRLRAGTKLIVLSFLVRQPRTCNLLLLHISSLFSGQPAKIVMLILLFFIFLKFYIYSQGNSFLQGRMKEMLVLIVNTKEIDKRTRQLFERLPCLLLEAQVIFMSLSCLLLFSSSGH